MSIDTSELNPLTTKIFKQENITTSGTELVRFLYVEGNGRIDELSLNSDKNTLKLRIVIDDTEAYNEKISWFATNNALLYNSDSNGTYKLSIRDLFFKNSFSIEYTPAEATTIDPID
jgi:hypothetical protein